MRALPLALLLALSVPSVHAQVQSRPTDPPLVTAASESWFVLREPIAIAGDVYYPAGATVFFSGYHMVRSGHYNGVPIYTDTTLEPYSVIFVPVSRGMLQPYERRRAGAMAGTTGSRMPSFPVRTVPDPADYDLGIGMAAVAPTALPLPPGAIGAYTPPMPQAPVVTTAAAPSAVAATPMTPTRGITTVRIPSNNDGVWVRFMGERWIHDGRSVPFDAATFVNVGDLSGFPVYARQNVREDVIYLPATDGNVARYRLK